MKSIDIDFTRTRILSGFDGKTCKTHPSLAIGDDGYTLLSYHMLNLSGSDVFGETYILKSTDGGETFSEPILQTALKEKWNGDIRTAYTAQIHYSKKHRKWFGIGRSTPYKGDNSPVLKDGVTVGGKLFFAYIDPEEGVYKELLELPFPLAYSTATAMAQIIEFENGDLLIPFYFTTPENSKQRLMTVRYTFKEDGLSIVNYGNIIAMDSLKRGLGEPSLAYLDGKYYMTIRSNEAGFLSISDDGYNFSEPRVWRFDDGKELQNYNTQQHWIRFKDGLFLAYTRKGSHNDHVFRHRAPIFMARFDEDRLCLIRDSEVILVPELGARLGNFNAIEVSEKECRLVTAEWMQPLGCEKYGSDNSLWIAKIFLKES